MEKEYSEDFGKKKTKKDEKLKREYNKYKIGGPRRTQKESKTNLSKTNNSKTNSD